VPDQPVIRIENLSKRYRLGAREQGYKTFREATVDLFLAPVKNLTRLRKLTRFDEGDNANNDGLARDDVIWALRDVSLEVNQGEVVGVIGRNGAGKSTLLKVLSRITEPTAGDIKLYGRVSSLLEVGTGFHPELTGRENIYLNGGILGMRKVEIDRKFDEIVDFAEIERFLDTPVKRYSSGMYVRLAFAVAAHLEPEILLVDEVLAVGDIGFQRKCLGKMSEVAGEGRTVLFVSHNMQAISALCSRSVMLDEGRISADSDTPDTLQVYYETLRKLEVNEETDITNSENRRGSGAMRFTRISIEDASGNDCSRFMMGDTVRFALSYQVMESVMPVYVGVLIRSGKSADVVTSANYLLTDQRLEPGQSGSVVIELPNIKLRPGEYPLYFSLTGGPGKPFDIVDDLTMPLIISTDKDFDELGFHPSRPNGYVNIESRMIKL